MTRRFDAVLDADVLIAGGGAAGLRAAAAALECGARVMLCSKKQPGSGGSTFLYPGGSIGMNAITHPETGDSPEIFYREILSAGQGALKKELAEILAERCTDEFRALEAQGVRFRRNADGSYRSVVPCFGRLLRGANADVADYRRALLRGAQGAEVLAGTSVLSLVVQDGVCCGAVAEDVGGRLLLLRAGAVIFATGGGADLLDFAESSCDLSADGCAMAYLAGVPLVNLEFIQFAPAIVHPLALASFWPKALASPFTLTNGREEAFLERYLPPGISMEQGLFARTHDDPFSASNEGRFFDVALFEEWRAGRACAHGGLRIRFSREGLARNPYPFTSAWAQGLERSGADLFGAGCEILPSAFACNGGILTGTEAETALPGLYAAGEAAGGMHGADRLGGNAMAATQVFGGVAGTAAAAFARRNPSAAQPEAALQQLEQALTGGGVTLRPEELTHAVRSILYKCGSLGRTQLRCAEGLALLKRMRARVNPAAALYEGRRVQPAASAWHRLLMAINMLSTMQARRESRGAHYRVDCPQRLPCYHGYFLVRRNEGGPELEFVPTQETEPEKGD